MDNRIEFYRRGRAAGMTPAAALVSAKRREAAGEYAVCRTVPRKFGMFEDWRPAWPRFFETVEETGLRFAGYADELARLRHTGWFTHPDEITDETLRGAVFKLPGGRGYVAGYQESCNDGFVIDPNNVFAPDCVAERESARREAAFEQAAKDCAYRADSIAERAANRERGYQQAWHDGQRFAELGEDLKTMRREVLAILAMRREVLAILAERHKSPEVQAPALCAAIRSRVSAILADIEAAREERAELLDSWDEGTPEHDAFRDGAMFAAI